VVRSRRPGPGEPLLEAMRFGRRRPEPANFSPTSTGCERGARREERLRVLDQLSHKYERHIYRLDQIPDEELDLSRHVSSPRSG